MNDKVARKEVQGTGKSGISKNAARYRNMAK